MSLLYWCFSLFLSSTPSKYQWENILCWWLIIKINKKKIGSTFLLHRYTTGHTIVLPFLHSFENYIPHNGHGRCLLCSGRHNPHQLHPVNRYTKDSITKLIIKRKFKNILVILQIMLHILWNLSILQNKSYYKVKRLRANLFQVE